MKNKRITFIFFLMCLSYCSTEGYLRRIGHFSKVSNTIDIDNRVIVDDYMRFAQDCHFGLSYHLDTDYINNNLEEMANGDNSIIGYRNLRIEFKLYPVLVGSFGGVLGLFCINFSGYAIHVKTESVQDLKK